MKNFKKCGYSYEKFQKNVLIRMKNLKKYGYSSMNNFKKVWLFQYEKFQKNVVILV